MKNHEKSMKLALDQARLALEESEFPVGCVLVKDNRVIATGRRANSQTSGSQQSANELDHAEIMALRNLLQDYPDLERAGITAYSTMEPCLMCLASLMLANIHTIVYAYEDVMGGATNLDLSQLAPLYRQKEITIIPDILREESLDLFRSFFSSPTNSYWQDSLLARHTLSQPRETSP